MLYVRLPIFMLVCSHCVQNKSLGDYVPIVEISKVVMRNSSGEFELSSKQLDEFKSEIQKLELAGEDLAKVGAVSMRIFAGDKEYVLITSTHGSYAELCGTNIGCSFFETNGVNFDSFVK